MLREISSLIIDVDYNNNKKKRVNGESCLCFANKLQFERIDVPSFDWYREPAASIIGVNMRYFIARAPRHLIQTLSIKPIRASFKCCDKNTHAREIREIFAHFPVGKESPFLSLLPLYLSNIFLIKLINLCLWYISLTFPSFYFILDHIDSKVLIY